MHPGIAAIVLVGNIPAFIFKGFDQISKLVGIPLIVARPSTRKRSLLNTRLIKFLFFILNHSCDDASLSLIVDEEILLDGKNYGLVESRGMIQTMDRSLEIKAHFPQGSDAITNYTDARYPLTFVALIGNGGY
jgi:hypothetical protein